MDITDVCGSKQKQLMSCYRNSFFFLFFFSIDWLHLPFVSSSAVIATVYGYWLPWSEGSPRFRVHSSSTQETQKTEKWSGLTKLHFGAKDVHTYMMYTVIISFNHSKSIFWLLQMSLKTDLFNLNDYSKLAHLNQSIP